MELLQPTQDLSVSVLVSACTYTAKLVAPLRRIIKDNKFTWSKVANDSFEAIKMAIALNFKNHVVVD